MSGVPFYYGPDCPTKPLVGRDAFHRVPTGRGVLVALVLGMILWSVLVSNGTAAHAAAAPPPNILIILADDLGYGDVQCFNPERGKIPTPQLDGLAAQGMRFTDAHSSSSVCSPSRYTLLTGRYHWRTRLQSGIINLWERPLIVPDRLTLAGLAKKRGYQTVCIGKWHLGWDWPISKGQRRFFQGFGRQAGGGGVQTTVTAEHRAAWRAAFLQPIGGGPITRGFDQYYGVDVPNWPPYCFIENDRTVGIPAALLPTALLRNNLASLQGPALEEWRLEAVLPTLINRTVEQIARHAQAKQPFLIYLPLTSPHTPLAVNEAWRGKSGLGAYADFVMETDAALGRVLSALQEYGAAENTLVVFTSDNGCAPYSGVPAMEKKGHFPSAQFRGYKGDIWEGGHRVPLIVRWPGVIAPGSLCTQTVGQADLMATLADILGLALPANAGEDSVSLWPLFRGHNKPIHDACVHHSSTGQFAIRQGKWKLIFCPGSGGPWTEPKDAAATAQGLPPIQLYDLEADPGERQNLQDQHPDVVARLTQLMGKLISDGRSTPGPKQHNDVVVDFDF